MGTAVDEALTDEAVSASTEPSSSSSEPRSAAGPRPTSRPRPTATGNRFGLSIPTPIALARHVDCIVQTIGRLILLGLRSFWFLAVDPVRLRHPWRETLNQAAFLVRVTAAPALMMSVPFGVIMSVQASGLIKQVGAVSLSGAIGGMGVMQQGSPIVVALLLGGAAGAAVATDLGARSIREEIDALLVMGINPVQRLVAPRLAAVIFVAPALCVFTIFIGLSAGYVIAVVGQGATPGSYLASFAAFSTPADMIVGVLKSVLFGVIAILIACQRGLETRGGARSVADAANASVVLGVASIIAMNLVLTELTTLFMPVKIG